MHTFYFLEKTAWISSGSNLVTGTTQTDQNFGKDEILELKKFYYNNSLDHVTRILVKWDETEFSQSTMDGDIPQPGTVNAPRGNSTVYLRLYEAEGNKELSETYGIQAHSISGSRLADGGPDPANASMSWDEGIGKSGDVPKVTDGVSWKYRKNPTGGNALTWSNGTSVAIDEGSIPYITASGYGALTSQQSWSNDSPDIKMDITVVTALWETGHYINNGFLLKFSGSQETDNETRGNLKFFSRHTNTIYAPKIEVCWDDHIVVTGSTTGSLTALDLTGATENYLYMKGLKESYKVGDRVKFRVGARQRYIQKTFSTSVQTISGSFIPEGSGSYAIKDVATDEYVVPFSPYTTMSCDTTSPYFVQWLDGFYPDRVYKILYKLKHDDGQEHIIDNNFEFKIKR